MIFVVLAEKRKNIGITKEIEATTFGILAQCSCQLIIRLHSKGRSFDSRCGKTYFLLSPCSQHCLILVWCYVIAILHFVMMIKLRTPYDNHYDINTHILI